MADAINLNTVRKARAKAEAKAMAETNRVLHGLPKAERDRAKADRERAEQHLDRTRREPPQD